MKKININKKTRIFLTAGVSLAAMAVIVPTAVVLTQQTQANEAASNVKSINIAHSKASPLGDAIDLGNPSSLSHLVELARQQQIKEEQEAKEAKERLEAANALAIQQANLLLKAERDYQRKHRKWNFSDVLTLLVLSVGGVGYVLNGVTKNISNWTGA